MMLGAFVLLIVLWFAVGMGRGWEPIWLRASLYVAAGATLASRIALWIAFGI